MANHLSAVKRARQTERRTERNRTNTSKLRTQLRELRESIAKGNKADAEQTYRQTVSKTRMISRDRAESKAGIPIFEDVPDSES